MPEYLNKTPEWVKNAIFYQIFPDRFAKSESVQKPGNFEPWESEPTIHGFKGGDLNGVTEHLDYLQDIGINAIYFNPIFQSASNHRYHTHDYYQVDPLLGGNAAFKRLLEAAHHRKIRVVIDGVFNHASRGFYPFNHILETEKFSPYLDWFTVRGFPLHAYEGKPNYDCWWNLPALPKFNIHNPQVRRYIFDIARYWIEQGVDGWRLDVPFEIDEDAFWQEFRQVVKTANPEAYIVGEIPSEAQRWLAGDQFDAVMNYQLTHAALSFFGGKATDIPLAEGMMGLPPVRATEAAEFGERTQKLLEIYPQEFSYAQLNLLSSHDMPRFLSLVSGDLRRLALAYLFILCYPGAPCIYYGDEIGLDGGRDPMCRKSFSWDSSLWNEPLREQIRSFTNLRQAIPALRTGSYRVLHTESKCLAFLREDAEDKVIVVMNAGEEPSHFDLDLQGLLVEDSSLQNQIGDEALMVRSGKLQIACPALSGQVFAALEQDLSF
ncbi:MAG: glycoside hydrolase family 13 protein [Anaerolineaceae bacterium]|nr:glycoside hydrolase family 13 protein [Anaerolineaceae bacterium]